MRRTIHGKRGVFASGLVLAVAACGGSTGAADPFADPPAPGGLEGERWSPDEILRSEITSRGKSDHTAMELIRRLRPGWLRPRGQKSLTDPSADYPVVYIDEIRHGGLSTLHRIPANEILSMRFFGTADATTRWGTGHPSGVINVVTGR